MRQSVKRLRFLDPLTTDVNKIIPSVTPCKRVALRGAREDVRFIDVRPPSYSRSGLTDSAQLLTLDKLNAPPRCARNLTAQETMLFIRCGPLTPRLASITKPLRSARTE